MTLHALAELPPPNLARALAEFEAKFTYPLGPDHSFRISHGDDYPRFFRAMGSARCFVAEKNGLVVGALGVAIRELLMPDGTPRRAAYIGDLKVDQSLRGSLVFLSLARAAVAWARPQVDAAYGVVMDGTRMSPATYTGRVGIPSFLQLGKVFVLRFPSDPGIQNDDPRWIASAEQGEQCFRALSENHYAASGGTPSDRSQTPPLWLVHPKGTACGRLEDTRAAKRLIDSDGVEMLSAHLACFAWRTPRAAAELIHVARRLAAARAFPALFTAVAEQDLQTLEPELASLDKVVAPATIFGAGLPAGSWNINTSEI